MLTVAEIGSGGAVVNSSDEIRASLLSQLETEVAGYTANIPAAITEDMLSTSNAAVAMGIGAAVDAQNCIGQASVTPEILDDMADSNGIASQASSTYTTVWVVFSGAAGIFIPIGTIVSGGGGTFTTTSSTGIASTGSSAPVLCISTTAGSFIIAPAAINTAGRTGLTVTNPAAAIAGAAMESTPAFRVRNLEAQRDMGQGCYTRLKRELCNIAGVQARLVSVRIDEFGIRIVVGGETDSYLVGLAIYRNILIPRLIIGSLDDSTRTRVVELNDQPDLVNINYIAPAPLITSITAIYDIWGDAGETWRQVIEDTWKALIIEYVNARFVGRPLSLIMLKKLMIDAVMPLLNDGIEISTLNFTVSLNQISAPPRHGTEDVYIDAESYFLTDSNNVFIHRFVNI